MNSISRDVLKVSYDELGEIRARFDANAPVSDLPKKKRKRISPVPGRPPVLVRPHTLSIDEVNAIAQNYDNAIGFNILSIYGEDYDDRLQSIRRDKNSIGEIGSARASVGQTFNGDLWEAVYEFDFSVKAGAFVNNGQLQCVPISKVLEQLSKFGPVAAFITKKDAESYNTLETSNDMPPSNRKSSIVSLISKITANIFKRMSVGCPVCKESFDSIPTNFLYSVELHHADLENHPKTGQPSVLLKVMDIKDIENELKSLEPIHKDCHVKPGRRKSRGCE